jgi:hypothetical protein
MSVIVQTDGMGWNLGGPLGSLPCFIQVESEFDIMGRRR